MFTRDKCLYLKKEIVQPWLIAFYYIAIFWTYAFCALNSRLNSCPNAFFCVYILKFLRFRAAAVYHDRNKSRWTKSGFKAHKFLRRLRLNYEDNSGHGPKLLKATRVWGQSPGIRWQDSFTLSRECDRSYRHSRTLTFDVPGQDSVSLLSSEPSYLKSLLYSILSLLYENCICH